MPADPAATVAATDGAGADPHLFWAPQAWVNTAGNRGGGWQKGVVLRVGADGHWSDITAGIVAPPRGATVLRGAVLPGLVDAHSHAFQRAFAGLAERREAEADDFWSWRDRMYGVALRITHTQLRAIAAQLYLELLAGGYTHVCEFHYLQHQASGDPYADPLTMGLALADAAADAGLGLTMMPVLYERAGFSQPGLRADQRRFRTDADWVWAAVQRLREARQPLLSAGIALHSLRAVTPGSLSKLLRLARDFQGPIHIHVAEQTAEVDDCVKTLQARPIEWLAREGLLDSRWQLVHATHTTREEIAAVARSGAGVVICPSTEGNLGDGFADLPGWLEAGVPIAIGSDSHVGRDWREELRWLDYGQRLLLRQRNVAAAPAAGEPSTAARLFDEAVRAGAGAAGHSTWGLQKGARADALVLNPHEPALAGVPSHALLDAAVFSSPSQPWRDVMVAGRWVLRGGQHPQQAAIAAAFTAAMGELWATGPGGSGG